MVNLEHMADFFLAFTQMPVLLLIVLIGFLWFSRPVFYQIFCVSVCNIVVNVALKGTFKVPLAASLGKVGYAFPSGHMELATVFYIWLAVAFASTYLRGAIVFLLFGVGMSLMYHGYHDFKDVLAGVVVGLLWVGICRRMLAHRFTEFLLISATVGMIYNLLIYNHIPIHAWVAYLTLLPLLISAKRRVNSP